MPDKLLEVKHLKKYFNTKNGLLHAVDDVSFDIERGETLGLVGESGCGKSTIGRAILRLHEPTGGEVLLNGVDVTKLNKQELRALRQKMQIVFQNLFAIADVDLAINHAVNAQLRLRNPLFVFAIFCFDVILDGVAVKAIRQGDVNAKMFKKDETEFFVRRAAHGVMQARFR